LPDRPNPTIAQLSQALEQEAENNPAARQLMTRLGVGAMTALAFVLIIGDPERRQSRLGSIQSLDLAFLVHAQHQSVFGRVQIQADDTFQFFRELGIVADLEAFDAMVSARDCARYDARSLADSHRCRHAARDPVRGVRWLLPRRHDRLRVDVQRDRDVRVPHEFLYRPSLERLMINVANGAMRKRWTHGGGVVGRQGRISSGRQEFADKLPYIERLNSFSNRRRRHWEARFPMDDDQPSCSFLQRRAEERSRAMPWEAGQSSRTSLLRATTRC
jgi:hypothetical protein